ncbi:RICIN domain-containing protein [Deinococcus sp.]|uniref:RICIN domain-containing protein n=1 Tax=Deinococcus sp. TaxID=47478 RepID=UPI003B597B24
MMISKPLLLATGTLSILLASCGSQGAAPVPAAVAPASSALFSAAALTTGFTSTIYSAANNNCVDVPGSTSDINAHLQGYTCNGTGAQSFIFSPVAGRPIPTQSLIRRPTFAW